MQNIILIGFMGCGKSTLGKKLAFKLDFEFIDSDQEIEKIEGKTITEIFEQHGEAYFRNLEKQYLEKIQHKQNMVLATGGGLPCFNKNIEFLNHFGITIYLKLSPTELTKRILHSKAQRPLIKSNNEEEVYLLVKKMLFERETFYHEAKHILNGKQQKVKFVQELLSE